jgi:uncharacterized protein YwgA
MNAEIYDLVSYAIVKANQDLKDTNISFGKTMIQKIIYFSLNDEDKLKHFRPYFFGPYSDEVQACIGALSYEKFIHNNENEFFISSSDTLKNKVKKMNLGSIEYNRIDSIIHFIKNNKIDYKKLSLMGKINIINHYFEGREILSITDDFIRSKEVNFNWNDFRNIQQNRFDECINSLNELTTSIAKN